MISQELLKEVLFELEEEGPYLTLLDTKTYGKREHCGACPVANYLSATFGDEYEFDVAGSYATVMRQDKYWEIGKQNAVSAKLPVKLRLFIRAFDYGEYPELDEENEGVITNAQQ
jgi:hypothetical protein